MQKYIEKIKALLNLAANAGSEAEATNALARIAEIQAKYNIANEDIHKATTPIEYGKQLQYGTVRREGSVWEIKLAAAIAQHHFCKIVYKASAKLIWFIGRPADIQICEYVFDAARAIMRHRLTPKFNEYVKVKLAEYPGCTYLDIYNAGKGVGREVFIRSWLEGAVTGLAHKYATERAKMQQNATHRTALMRIDAALNKYMEGLNVRHTALHENNASSEALVDGFKTGINMQINTALNDSGEFNITKAIKS